MKSLTMVLFATRKIAHQKTILWLLISYRHMFNMERLLITSPKAIGEVLTTKSYNFVKPRQLRAGLGRILGVGILLAEGDEHRVCDHHAGCR